MWGDFIMNRIKELMDAIKNVFLSWIFLFVINVSLIGAVLIRESVFKDAFEIYVVFVLALGLFFFAMYILLFCIERLYFLGASCFLLSFLLANQYTWINCIGFFILLIAFILDVVRIVENGKKQSKNQITKNKGVWRGRPKTSPEAY